MKKYKITYLKKSEGFKRTDQLFSTFEQAIEWGKKNLDNFNTDMIQHII